MFFDCNYLMNNMLNNKFVIYIKIKVKIFINSFDKEIFFKELTYSFFETN